MIPMTRVPTSIRSAALLARLLRELGFPDVEQHDTPVPLFSWNGRPTGAVAEVVLRRKALGAIADDLGFARRADGTFEAVLAGVHKFRFDRRWFRELEARHAAAAPAHVDEPRPAPPAPPALVPAPSPAPTQPTRTTEMAPGEIARREVEAGVAKVIRCATDRGILRSCTASLLVLWLLMLAAANTTRDRWTGMIVFTAAFAVLLKAAWAINAARAVRAGRREFEQRFPLGSAQRADAQRQLSEALGRFDPRTRAVLGRILASTGHRVRRG